MKRIIISLNLISMLSYGVGSLEIKAPGYDFQEADYSTSHVFIDEVADLNSSIEVLFDLNDFSNITDVEIFSNINRRDLARIDKDEDGYADGIQPPNGNLITDSAEHTNTTNGHYYIPINMNDGDTNKIYELTIPINKTGSYRLTARFKTNELIPENNYNDHLELLACLTSKLDNSSVRKELRQARNSSQIIKNFQSDELEYI